MFQAQIAKKKEHSISVQPQQKKIDVLILKKGVLPKQQTSDNNSTTVHARSMPFLLTQRLVKN